VVLGEEKSSPFAISDIITKEGKVKNVFYINEN
jgi:hypothetical protein